MVDGVPDDYRYILPPGHIVRRARDWRLYDQAGTRYTDFWQADGAAFLGHRPPGLARTLSAEIDRGLWAPMPTAWDRRLEKVLTALAQKVGVGALIVAHSRYRWRPLAVDAAETPEASAVHEAPRQVVLPFPAALALRTDGTPPSPVVLAGLVVAAGALLRYLDSNEAEERRALAHSLPAPPGYRRCGVYWWAQEERARDPAGAAARYDRLREKALRLKIVLPPQRGLPIVCPGDLGRHEKKRWEELCADRIG